MKNAFMLIKLYCKQGNKTNQQQIDCIAMLGSFVLRFSSHGNNETMECIHLNAYDDARLPICQKNTILILHIHSK